MSVLNDYKGNWLRGDGSPASPWRRSRSREPRVREDRGPSDPDRLVLRATAGCDVRPDRVVAAARSSARTRPPRPWSPPGPAWSPPRAPPSTPPPSGCCASSRRYSCCCSRSRTGVPRGPDLPTGASRFLSGVGVSLIIGNLSGMLGFPASGSTWDKLTQTLSELDQANWTTAALAFRTVIVMLGLEAKMPRSSRPGVADPVQRDRGRDRRLGQRCGQRRRSPPACPASPSRRSSPGSWPAGGQRVLDRGGDPGPERGRGPQLRPEERLHHSVKGDLVGLSAANLASAFTSGSR